MMTAQEIFEKSPTIREAAKRTIEFCVEQRITDEAEIGEILEATVRAVQAELERTIEERRDEIIETILLRTYVAIRLDKGLDVPAHLLANAGYQS